MLHRAAGPIPSLFLLFTYSAFAADPLTWQQIKERFLAQNPSVAATRLGVQETRANEITAGLRPNPIFSMTTDQYQVFRSAGSPFQPLANSQFIPTVTQLWERRNKRKLRVADAQLATSVAKSDQEDFERNLLFTLRDAYNHALQSQSLLAVTKENLRYYDQVIAVNRERLRAGDISNLDLQRVELQRIQFESDVAAAEVNLRTSKIQLLTLLNENTPVDSFEVAGDFDYKDTILDRDSIRRTALDSRSDLRSAMTAIERARVDNQLAWANGSADPTIGGEYLWNSQVNNTVGVSVNIPIRLFDKNQGEKARTAIEITRSTRARDAVQSTVLRDVDTALANVDNVRRLLQPYRDKYLDQARNIRETVSFSYANGAASLLEFLDAQKSYRDTQMAYLNLIGTYLGAVAQLNLAVGEEVVQ